MTILYKPVLIESVEQAEALDGKTPVQIVLDRTREVHDVNLFEDFAEDFWPDALEPGNRWVYVALVSTEAEECHSEDYGSYHFMEAVELKPFTAYLVDQEEA